MKALPLGMSPRDKVLTEALSLSEKERLLLAREILESLTGLSSEDEAELLSRMSENRQWGCHR